MPQMASSAVAVTTLGSSIYPNQSSTLMATVSVNGATPGPTGTVNFMLGATSLGSVVLIPIDQSDSTATLAVNGSQFAIGGNNITAVYSGDENYSGSTSPAITVTLTSSVVNFGTVAVGSLSATQTLSYQFTSAATLLAVNILTAGAAGLDYADGGDSTCTAGATFLSGQSCTVTVILTPSAPGQRAGGVTLFAQGNNTALMTWYLTGIGESSAITIDPGAQTTIGTINGGAPYGSAIDGGGNVYVVDHSNSQVLELAATTFTPSTVVASSLVNPTAVALDGAGNLYISDTGNSRVLIVPNEQGTLNVSDMSNVSIGTLGSPRGITVDGAGNLYVADGANGVVVELPAGGTTPVIIASGLMDPHGITVDATGNIYVSSAGGVTEYLLGGGSPVPIGSGYSNPRGLAVDASGTVYIADTANGRIVEVFASGLSQSNFAVTGLVAPEGISLDSADNLYVTDSSNVYQVNRTQAAGLVFPATNVGSVSAAQTLTVSDAGNQQLTLSNLAITGNFTQVTSNGTDCYPNASLSAGGECLVALTFVPQSTGTLAGEFTLSDNALNNASAIQFVPLSGAGNSVATATTVLASSNPSYYGESPALTAMVMSGSSTPTGSVSFADGTINLGSATLGGGVATLVTSSLSAGSHSIVANYNGNFEFSPSSSVPLVLNVNQTATKLGLSSSAIPSIFSQAVTFIATIAPQYGGAATGTITFKDGSTSIGSSVVNGNSASLTLAGLTVGTHSVTAVYSGDANVTGSSSTVVAEIVDKAATSSSVTSSANRSTVGGTVIFTITVAPQFSGIPSGTVTLKKNGSNLITLSLNSGQASYTISSFALGSYNMTAVYTGDANFSSNTSPALKQVVNKVATTTTITSSANPSNLGQAITFTAATISSTGTAPPNGEVVTFKNGSTTLGTGSLLGGSATFTTSSLAPGSDSIIATYAGDTTFAPSTSQATVEVVNKYSTVTTVASSGSPSTVGQSVPFTATVSSSSTVVPTGNVTFKNGTATLGTKLLSSGSAVLSISTLTVGTHTITVLYSGDANNAASTSVAISQIVANASSSQMTPSTTRINFANADGTPLAPGQTGYAAVTFTIGSGPMKIGQSSPLCIPAVAGADEYTSECDEVEMDEGCVGTWQAGQQCTTTFRVLADTDDNECDVNGPNVAYPGVGCRGIIQIRVPNVPFNGLYQTILQINYTYQWFNPKPAIKISPTTLNFPNTQIGMSTPPTLEFQILNPDDAPLNLNSVMITTGKAFTIVANNCPNQLLSLQSCSATVSFNPTNTGLNSGTITVSDNDTSNNAPTTIQLQGTGLSP
jgi:sugar lactone lactonase YvrE